MTTLSKNHKARLTRVAKHLDTALDKLMQANGELWPQELRGFGTRVQEIVREAQDLHKRVSNAVASAQIVADPVENDVDPNQTDIEDYSGVAQDQPEPSHIEDLENDEPGDVPADGGPGMTAAQAEQVEAPAARTGRRRSAAA